MAGEHRPPRPTPRPVQRPVSRPSPNAALRPGVRPPARGWAPQPGGPRHWASKRTIPAQALTLVGPDQELIAGRHPVEEAFVARREAVKLLVVPQRRAALQQVVLHATALRIPIVEVEGALIGQLAGFDGHQGVALVVRRRPEVAPEEILARAVSRGEPPFILALDGVEDPQNFGSLIRSAEAVGVHGILMATRGSAPLSPAAIKASAGAVEHLLVSRVENLADELTALAARGVRVIGAEAKAVEDYRSANLQGPICLVIGSEGKGLSPAIRRRINLYVRIPMVGKVASLNASVAGSILLFEVLGQRLVSAARGVPALGGTPPAAPGSGDLSESLAPQGD